MYRFKKNHMFSKRYSFTGILLQAISNCALPIQSRDPTFPKPSYIVSQTQVNGVLGKQNYKQGERFTCKMTVGGYNVGRNSIIRNVSWNSIFISKNPSRRLFHYTNRVIRVRNIEIKYKDP